MLRFVVLCLTLTVVRAANEISPCVSGTWASTCPASPAPYLINMNLELRNFVVAAHNARRNRLALGQLPGYQSARRMAFVRWDADLASRAELNVKQCIRKRDTCHGTARFPNSGQNIAYFAYDPALTDRTDHTRMPIWESSIVSPPPGLESKWIARTNQATSIGKLFFLFCLSFCRSMSRFAVMAQERNLAVGCAASRFVKNNQNHFLVACNYAVKNTVGSPVYVTGPAGSGCQTGVNIDYPGLCKFAENYNI
ncbi:PREDICTED: venom allergen 5-like [Drosophila arizonae]|uniref:Venom allergen 5-like n=1 Tax=Drosophila arizonae TaxID=7263 RepID=A0ABM1Q1W2_DROAR|nr:PREDICTED: venom allergen 5-like [Drosophila arizonae]